MISPHTKPGTKIVCIDAELSDRYRCRPSSGRRYPVGLRLGGIYTVQSIMPHPLANTGFGLSVDEIAPLPDGRRYRFALERFRYLELPSCLMELLETAPTRAPSELEPTQ